MASQENISGLEVSMNDTVPVRGIERVAYINSMLED